MVRDRLTVGKDTTVKKMPVVSMMTALAVALMTGCASTPKGPTDEELISKLITDWTATGVAEDIDKIMTFYSDAFQSYEYGDKAGLKRFLQDAKDMGYMQDASFDTAKTKVEIKDGEAKAYPIDMKASFGSASIELVLKKEGSAWMITGMDVQQF